MTDKNQALRERVQKVENQVKQLIPDLKDNFYLMARFHQSLAESDEQVRENLKAQSR